MARRQQSHQRASSWYESNKKWPKPKRWDEKPAYHINQTIDKVSAVDHQRDEGDNEQQPPSSSYTVFIILPRRLQGKDDNSTIKKVSNKLRVTITRCDNGIALKMQSNEMSLLVDGVSSMKTVLGDAPPRQYLDRPRLFIAQPGSWSPLRPCLSISPSLKRPVTTITTSDIIVLETSEEARKELRANLEAILKYKVYAAAGRMLDEPSQVRIRVLFGYLQVGSLGQTQDTVYTYAQLHTSMNKLAGTGGLRFLSVLECASAFGPHLTELFTHPEDPGVVSSITLEITTQHIRVETELDLKSKHAIDDGGRRAANPARIYTRGADSYINVAVAAPHRTHDWCLTAECIPLSKSTSNEIQAIVKSIAIRDIIGLKDGLEHLELSPYRRDQLLAYAESLAIKKTITVPAPSESGSDFVLELSVIRSWKKAGSVDSCELALFAPKWNSLKVETSSNMVADNYSTRTSDGLPERSASRIFGSRNWLDDILKTTDDILQRMHGTSSEL